MLIWMVLRCIFGRLIVVVVVVMWWIFGWILNVVVVVIVLLNFVSVVWLFLVEVFERWLNRLMMWRCLMCLSCVVLVSI